MERNRRRDKESEDQERREIQMEPNIHLMVRTENVLGNMNQIIDQLAESHREEDQPKKEQIERFDEKETNQRAAHQVVRVSK
jgi:hypothetical protein